ncbi:MAG TPA: metalloregulator ArsR/SmtB family transcription factor [Roseimicrobium sp.]|nr:metalloregulator ArsR/SmtB family transcription factor [Roseimicrobium sp.]
MSLLHIYEALCDETRLRVVHLLSHGPLCVCHIQSVTGASQVTVSKHLSYLKKRGLVVSRRHGQWMIYSLPGNPVPELTAQLKLIAMLPSTSPVLKKDLVALKKLEPDCCWIDDVVNPPKDSGRK